MTSAMWLTKCLLPPIFAQLCIDFILSMIKWTSYLHAVPYRGCPEDYLPDFLHISSWRSQQKKNILLNYVEYYLTENYHPLFFKCFGELFEILGKNDSGTSLENHLTSNPFGDIHCEGKKKTKHYHSILNEIPHLSHPSHALVPHSAISLKVFLLINYYYSCITPQNSNFPHQIHRTL